MENIFFDNWESLARIFVVTILAYVSIVFLLRVSGKRTLAKMNAFDFIVTVALGSCLATVALNKSVPLANGVLAVFLLIFLQFTITWLAVRYKIVKNIVTSKPILLVYKGEVLHGILKKSGLLLKSFMFLQGKMVSLIFRMLMQ